MINGTEDNNQQYKAGTTGNASEQAFAQAGVSGQQYQQNDRTTSRVTAASLNTNWRRAFGRNRGGQAITDLSDAMRKSLKARLEQENITDVDYTIDTIDASAGQSVGISAVLVSGILRTSQGRSGVTFVMPLEGSVSSMPVVDQQVPGTNRQVPIQWTAGDYMTDNMWEAIEQRLKSQYGDDIRFHSVGSMAVPRIVNIDEPNWKDQVDDLLFASLAAVDTNIDNHFRTGISGLTIGDITADATTAVNLSLSDVPSIGDDSLPRRADMSVAVRASVASGVKGVPDRLVNIARADGFLNLIYTHPDNPQQGRPPETQRYTAQFLIRQNRSETNLVTLATTLLNIGVVPILQARYQYLAALLPVNSQGNKLRDAGAMGLEVNALNDPSGQPTGKEDLAEMDPESQFKFLQACLFEGLHVGMVVEESGPTSWLDTIFLQAAMVGNEGAEARRRIFDELNHMSGGCYGKLRGPNDPICRVNPNRIHLGYYFDADKTPRDALDLVKQLQLLMVKSIKNYMFHKLISV